MDFDMTAEEIAALKNRPITFDSDCPPTSRENFFRLKGIMEKYNTRTITKEILRNEKKIIA